VIVRGPRAERDFTIIRNATLRDARLTFKARGLLAFILSQPEGYRVSAEELAVEGPDGRDAIRSALREMEAGGYLRREKRRTGDGRLMTDAVLYEVPLVAENPLQPETENPSPVRPGLFDVSAGQTGDGLTDAGKPVANRRTSDLEGLEGLTTPPADNPLLPVPASDAVEAPHTFEHFWTAFPLRVGKGAARKAWPKAVKAAGGEAHRIIAAAVAFAVDPNRDPEFTPHPATWLNQERWEDDPLPPRQRATTGAGSVPPGWHAIAEARAMRGAM
jgi:hypothetical protein